jgi:hypothetical protein
MFGFTKIPGKLFGSSTSYGLYHGYVFIWREEPREESEVVKREKSYHRVQEHL